MKKFAILALFAVLAAFGANAQKFALVDMEYILKNVPSYEMANEQLSQLSQRWQKEVEAIGKEAESLYQNYLADKVFLTDEQVKKREEEVVAKEKEATCTRNASPCLNPSRTMFTTPSKNLHRNVVSRQFLTAHQPPRLFTPRPPLTSQTTFSPKWAMQNNTPIYYRKYLILNK